MEFTIVDLIIDLLRLKGIRANEAYPGKQLPALTAPAAAVRLGKVDRTVRSTAIQITIMSPSDQGGTVCEATALQTVQILEELKATCHKDICRFDHMADVFYIEVTADFMGVATADSWSPGPGFSVYIGAQPMEWATGFSIHRKTEDPSASISGVQWSFTLEEVLGPGSIDPPDPAEPFVITVKRPTGEEVFTGCTWTSVEREDTIRGIRQIRKGVAAARSVSGFL